MEEEDNWKAMFYSIWKREGNNFIQFLLDAGLDVNALNKYGKTMLSYAAEWGNLEITEFLVERGANGDVKNSDGSKPLHIAALYGRKDIVKFFLGKGISANSCDNHKCTPLHYVGRLRHISSVGRESYQEIVHLLIDNNADLDAVNRVGCTPLLSAARKHIVELFINLGANVNCCDEDKVTILHHSSSIGWTGIVRSLLEGKFTIDLEARAYWGYTPLFLAASFKHKDIVELLIKAGSNLDCSDSIQRTPLHESCLRGCLDVVKCLVNAGCDLNAKDFRGQTPLVVAAEYSNCSVVEYLIDFGANLGICDKDGCTILHFVCKEGWLGVIKSLIKKGFDLNVQDNFLNTPLHFAVRGRKLTSVSYLLKAGADCNLKNIYGITAFHQYILGLSCFSSGTSIYLEVITLFIENGAYIQSNDYNALTKVPVLKEGILQNVNLCTLSVINQFNNAELRKVYEILVVAERLPSIEKLKIASQGNVAQDIAKCVEFEIQTKEYCNLLNVSPIVLCRLCVGSLVKYYNN